ncbi:MAG TPA: cupin domain-containing protein [Symbiobacteriaceae bacterium]|nr:cupin domain-containing protein [Symbiobacteriaceae bacterium]
MSVKIHTLSTVKAAGTEPLVRECLYAAIPHDFNYVQADPGLYKEPHAYGAGDSFMLVLAGSLELIVDGETYSLKAGQMAVIPCGAVRGFTAGPEGMTMMAAHLRNS